VLSTSSKRTWHSPSNAHAYRLYIFKDLTKNNLDKSKIASGFLSLRCNQRSLES
jgi:hypothetical protein